MDRKPTVRIFISSPSDVRPERLIAERVITRLNREFAYHFDVLPLLWEREPLTADAHFQANITPPRKTDIVVVILWSRLGVPLPEREYLGPLSHKPVTGTEWEFEDALSANRERGVPALLVYRKLASILASLDDDARLEEQRRQKALVEGFMRHWFMEADGKSFIAAHHVFDHAAEFEENLENHLRELLRKRINDPSAGAGIAGEPEAPIIRWQGAPFRGLLSFDFDHHDIFFGRTRARNELRELLALRERHGNAFVLVMGASGSGKSSVVKAGLLPDLMLPGMVGRVALCRYAVIRPTSVPGDLMAGLAQALISDSALPELARAPLQYTVENLAALLRGASGQMALPIEQGLSAAAQEARLTEHAEARLALVVDQLEELFTQDHITQAERQSFVRALEALARSGKVWVVATLRSDFFDRLETLPELESLSRDARYLLTPATAAELGHIIRQPARLAGVRFEHDAQQGTSLDEAILQAAAGNPGALPLLSFLLDQLWQGRTQQGMLTSAHYRQLGGLEGALGQRAEEVFQQLAAPVQQALAGVLRTLVTVTQDEAAVPTARTVAIAQFPEGTPRWQLVQALLAPEARLLIAFEEDGEGKVRVAHEALLTHWMRAKEQIQMDLVDFQIRARLEQAEARWREADAKYKESLLLAPGLPLSEAEDLAQRHQADLPQHLHDYIRGSVATARQREKRRLRLLQAVAAVLAVFLIAAGTGAWFGFKGQWAAKAQARVALSRQLAVQANEFLDGRGSRSWTLGALLALEASTLSPDLRSTGPLFKSKRQLEVRATLLETSGVVTSVAFSPDGKTLAMASDDKTVHLWDVVTRKPVGEPLRGHEDEVSSVAFSPDGKTLATASNDKTVRLWDMVTQTPVGKPLRGHEDGVSSVAFSPDGKTLATASLDKTVRLWDTVTQTPVGKPLLGDEGEVLSVAFSPDGKTLATASLDKTVRLWDMVTRKPVGKPLLPHDSIVTSIAFSPDGKTLAMGSWDKTVRLWDMVTQTPAGDPLRGNDVRIVAFSSDGKTLATGGTDHTVQLWDMVMRTPIGEPLRGHEGDVISIAFSPDGKTLATASEDMTVRLWDVVTRTRVSEPLRGPEGKVSSVAFSPDGKMLATASGDMMVRLWDVVTRKPVGKPLLGHDSIVTSVAFSPDGKTLAMGGWDKTVRLWDVATRNLVGELLGGHDHFVLSIAYSPDGKTLATGSTDNAVRLWDLVTRTPIGEPLRGHEGYVGSIAFSPDGKTLATASDDMTVRLWDAVTRKLVGEPLRGHERDVNSVAFSPDGKTLATGGSDQTVRLWDVVTRTPIGEPLRGHEARVTSVAFSPDGKTLATGSWDSTVRLWDMATRNPVGEPLRGRDHFVLSVAYSPDGKTLATGITDNAVRLWDIDFRSWPAYICGGLHRNLTRAEWREFIGDILPYRKTCPNLPEPPN